MKDQFARIGPGPVPLVPISDFHRLKQADLEAAWKIVGPSAQKNLETGPLWSVIAAAYLEGLEHGHGLEEEIQRRKE